jgi:DNA helicase-2/ATP-dependent DNA helicase PcrA
MTLTFAELAELTTEPGKPVYPITEEQQAIVDAPLAPALVTAGAGSGKTHTMMLRILWLVANRGIAPSQILGLTFTRKAAGELRERVEQGLERLRRAGRIDVDEFNLPQVSTYNSYASGIYQQYALLVGREPDAMLLDEPSAFSLMRQVVLDSDEPALGRLDTTSVASIARGALGITRAMRENGRTLADVEAHAEEVLGQMRELGGSDFELFTKELREKNVRPDRFERLVLSARLGEEYQRRKRELGYVEFSDQVAYAAQIVSLDEGIAAEVRGELQQVILDEYQDTSVGQTTLFADLFRGRAVMAVGDPKQSIYAWRGASAANMKRFPYDFARGGDCGAYTLTTSWRNDRAVLELANTIAGNLPAGERGAQLVASPSADKGDVAVRHLLTDADEAAAVAEWFKGHLAANPEATGAILVRTRRPMSMFAEALRAADVPHQIIGLGGLLRTPEIVDLTALLRAAADEYAGNEVLRLLFGARFELGLADIDALTGLAKKLSRRGADSKELADAERAAMRADLRDGETGVSLAEALEFVRTARDATVESWASTLTAEGRARLREAAQLLHEVRSRMDLPLVDWVTQTIELSRLADEATANPRLLAGRANLDAFVNAIADYASSVPSSDIHEFLDWLELTFAENQLSEFAPTPPKRGVVQLTTIHSSKGLEWDHVAVVQLANGKLPNSDGKHSLISSGELPNALREDRDDLPHFPLEKIETLDDLKAQFKLTVDDDTDTSLDESKASYSTQRMLQLVREDRRLAYVAFTRAKHGLLLTSSRWQQGKSRPLTPSPFLLELRPSIELEHTERDAAWATIDGAPVVFTSALDSDDLKELNKQLSANPLAGEAEVRAWPAPPMRADHLAQLHELADAVELARGDDAATSKYDELTTMLLAERERDERGPALQLPRRFGASLLHDLFDDPAAIAQNAARPMPQRPYRATLVGNLFHSWVEGLYREVAGGGAALEGADFDDPDFADAQLTQLGDDDRQQLEQLQATFLASRFTADGRRPDAVELPVDTPLGEYTIVNKIDAVYVEPDGTVEIVDWKTGRAPTTDDERAGRELQLMSYAHAYSAAYDVPLERIRATLYSVAHDREISVREVLGADALLQRLRAAEGSLTAP